MDIERLTHEVKDFKRSSDKVERLEIDLAKLQDKYRLEVTQVEKDCDVMKKKF